MTKKLLWPLIEVGKIDYDFKLTHSFLYSGPCSE